MAFSGAWGGRKLFIIGLSSSICLCSLTALIIYLLPGPIKTLNNRIYDLKLSLFAGAKVCPSIVHVDVDDQAISKYGQWPWDRDLSARIVDRLTQLGAKVIVFDLVYSSEGKSKNGDQAFVKRISESGRVIVATGLVESEPWVKEFEAGHDKNKLERLYQKAWRLTSKSMTNLREIKNPRDSGLPLSPIIKAAREIGHINSTPDRDGIHRRIPMMLKWRERVIPSLSLAALVSYLNARPDQVVLYPTGELQIHHANGAMRIPLDSQASLLINWRPVWETANAPACFNHYTALDLLREQPDPSAEERYKDKIVVVGVAWTGAADMGASPLEDLIPLSRTHSSALETMLTGGPIREIPPFPWVIVVSVVTLALFLVATMMIRMQSGVILCLAISIIFCAVVLVAFWLSSLEIPSAEAFLMFLPSAVTFLAFRAVSTEKDRQLIRDCFGRYLSDEVVAEILESPGGVNLEGELKDMSVLVSDLRGFTPITEALEPKVALKAINRYFERMTDIIMRHRGTIEEFTGDGVFVLFGAPRPMADHDLRAVICAIDMQNAMLDLNRENLQLGLPELQMGIGINSGQVLVGNIGSEKRQKYGALGKEVNIAFRVEAQTAGGEILITQRLYERIEREVVTGPPRTVQLKGLRQPVTLFPVIKIRHTTSV